MEQGSVQVKELQLELASAKQELMSTRQEVVQAREESQKMKEQFKDEVASAQGTAQTYKVLYAKSKREMDKVRPAMEPDEP